MSLFPAYADATAVAGDVAMELEQAPSEEAKWSPAPSPGQEYTLLASDSEEEAPPPSRGPPETRAPSSVPPDYYEDHRADRGNLRVSTLYYPGRPEYLRRAMAAGKREKLRGRRYWRETAGGDKTAGDSGAAARYRRALRDNPRDIALWLEYIDYQESIAGQEMAALEAADEAMKALPDENVIVERWNTAARLALAGDQYCERVRDRLQTERDGGRRGALWARLIGGVACAPSGGAPQVLAVASAAASDPRADPVSYGPLLLAYGGFLRAAGLWEDLVQLVELVSAMAFPPGPFPPPRDGSTELAAEEQLAEYEQRTMSSGLPAGEVWARIERARAALQWRGPAGSLSPRALAADPQRVPVPADVTPLLRPLTDRRVAAVTLVTLLRLAEVPLMPASEHLSRAVDPMLSAHEWCSGAPPGVLSLLRCARRLPPAHPARPSPLSSRRLLSLTPPRILANTNGFGQWVDSLWEAATNWAGDERARIALACWRLRWLHARALLLGKEDVTEARKLRAETKQILRNMNQVSAALLAQAARVEAATCGPARGLHAARAALRLVLTDPAVTTTDALYLARVVGELAETEGSLAAAAAEARWALACAALRRPLPQDTTRPPDSAMIELALQQCEEHCAALDESSSGAAVWGHMVPGAEEWAAARAALAPPHRRRELIAQLLEQPEVVGGSLPPRAREAAACALVAASQRDHCASLTARRLHRLFPHNAYLALMSAGCPLWARGGADSEPRGLATLLRELAAPRDDTAAMAAALPHVLRALDADWTPQECTRASRALTRSLRGGAAHSGGWVLWAWLLYCSRPTPPVPLALSAAPHAHALHTTAAQLWPPEALQMPHLLLERQLRLHALPSELADIDTAEITQ